MGSVPGPASDVKATDSTLCGQYLSTSFQPDEDVQLKASTFIFRIDDGTNVVDTNSCLKWVRRKERSLGDLGHPMIPCSESLDGAGGALVDAGSAVAALGGVDHGDILAGDGVLGANIDACTACDALGSVDCCHLNYLWSSDFRGEYINLPNYELGIS